MSSDDVASPHCNQLGCLLSTSFFVDLVKQKIRVKYFSTWYLTDGKHRIYLFLLSHHPYRGSSVRRLNIYNLVVDTQIMLMSSTASYPVMNYYIKVLNIVYQESIRSSRIEGEDMFHLFGNVLGEIINFLPVIEIPIKSVIFEG